MNKEHLLKIINNTWCKYAPITEENEQFQTMFEPKYEAIPFGEQNIKTCLVFDHREEGLTYVKGELSCAGLLFEFKHERFEKVLVTVFYDNYKKEIYNSVLAKPKYSVNDWRGKKSIRQTASKILSEKDLSRYFKRLYKRFECPVVA